MKENLKYLQSAIAGSYSQVFFSNNQWLALLLFLAAALDPCVGISGFIAVVAAIGIAKYIGLNPAYIRNGWYTYNVLLTGMALGANFQFTLPFLIILLLAAVLSLFITVWLASFTSKYRVPFLSLPFIVSVWIIFLNARSFQTGLFVVRNEFMCQNILSQGFGQLSFSIEKAGIPNIVMQYFKAMSSIFFQHNLISGLLMSIGLLISSRIAFFLSWFGFLAGWLFYRFAFGVVAVNEYYLSGFNYIFAAVALAGFYLIPSTRSFLLVIVTVPLIAFFNAALFKFLAPHFLPLYSLSFTLVLIIIMSVLNNRFSFKKLDIVQYQLYSPEKNLYAFNSYMERFKKDTLIQIHLPFYGEWTVSQGHSGSHTHKEEWQYALDFIVTDEHKQSFKLPGKTVSDFYCYALPVLAPADGEVVSVEEDVDDNSIGDVNLNQNWGNTLVIKHSEFLYSKLSHLKKGSIKVKSGDKVKRGEVLGQCGNSGRSPEPHIHFQLQNTAYIAAPTINYPIGYFITNKNNQYKLHAFEIPKENDIISRPIPTPLLTKAFHFIPGMKFNFEVNDSTKTSAENWEVFTDAYNHSYLYCAATKSTAHFNYNDTLFYFTGFSGNKNSLLYYFYLAAYKVVLCYYPGLETKDFFPVEVSTKKWLMPLQDFVAPFHTFIKPAYRSVMDKSDNANISIHSGFYEEPNSATAPTMAFDIELVNNKINSFTINSGKLCITAKNTA